MEEAIPLTDSQKIAIQKFAAKHGCKATTFEGVDEWVALLKQGYNASRRAFFTWMGEAPEEWRDEAMARIIAREDKRRR